MAGYRATKAVLEALKDRLSLRMAALLGGTPVVKIVGAEELGTAPTTEALGIYLYRIAVDPFARNRYVPSKEGRRTPQPETPINLHIMLIGWSNKTDTDINYLSAAVQIIGSAMNLGIAHVGVGDASWNENDTVQIIPEEMSTEDLTRLWDSFRIGYRLSVPYIIKTVRLSPDEEQTEGPPVKTLVFPAQTSVEREP